MKTMTASVASKGFGRFLDTVQREPVVITKKNRPVAVTLSIQDAQAFFDFKVEQGIERGLADIEAGRFEVMTEQSARERLERFKAKHAK